MAKIRAHRVGGTYWAKQPPLPQSYVLVRSAIALAAAESLGGPCVLWSDRPTPENLHRNVLAVSGECDPWHMLDRAEALVVDDRDDQLALIAALLDVPVRFFDPSDGRLTVRNVTPTEAISAREYRSPFSGDPMTAEEAVELCGFWRQLIDSNRTVAAGLGFAFWKQEHVAPLLWNGSEDFRFARDSEVPAEGLEIAIWRSKVSPEALSDLTSAKVPLVEVEDGFLRSRGLGADCIPPLSITVDREGAYFDPCKASELELLLQEGEFDDEIICRARELRQLIVELGLSKYEQGMEHLPRPAGDRRTILVPGQVEDDRAVMLGGCGLSSNLELLAKVRDENPDAYILYKPHPDVLAGHRRGAVPEQACLLHADEISTGASIGSLVAMVDEVHVNTSLAGFEALVHGKRVATYGVPFYAGWGLTDDHGPVPARRTATRSLDELVAATLLIYPRYLDPVSGLPCPAEIVVARLADGAERDSSLLVGVRRMQGKLMRRLRSLVQ